MASKTPSNVIDVTPVDELPPVLHRGRQSRDFSQFLKNPGVWCRVNRTYSKGSASIAKGMANRGQIKHGGTWEGKSRTIDGDTFLFVKYTPEVVVQTRSTRKSTSK